MKSAWLAALLSLVAGAALAGPSLPGVPTQPIFDLSNDGVTATGGTSQRTLAAWMGDLVNVKAQGAKGDGQIATPTVTLSGTSLTVGSSLFAATDVGKTIIITGAGVAPTTGPVLNVPVTAQGGGYTAVPSCAITDSSSSGSGATCTAVMAIQSVTLTTGGSGCVGTDGTYTFIVGIDGTGTPAQFTGTIASGVLTSITGVTTGGNFTAMGATTSVPVYGANCTTAPTVGVSYGVSSISISAIGSAYSTTQTTASLSGGSPTTPATLGSVVVGAPVPPLVTTIAGYTSATQVTLTAPASTAISGVATQIFWGTDDTAAFQAAINAGAGKGVWIPTGMYWIGSKLAPSASDEVIRGEGPSASVLVWDSGTVTTQNAAGWSPMFGSTGIGRSNMRGSLFFEDLQFRGLLDFGRVNSGAAALEVNYYHEISFDRTKFYQIPNMAMALEGNDLYRVTNSVFEDVMRDQARCRSCFNSIVSHNRFLHSDDDSVALHQATYVTGAGNIREGMIVEDNDFEDTTCIHLLGARNAIIRGNTMRRCKFWGINISWDSGEGLQQIRNIVISDNNIQDTVARIPLTTVGPCAICVTVNSPNAPTGITSLLPGSNAYPSSYFPKPWDYDLNSVASGAAFAPSARGVVIHDNITLRTLPAVATYSSWGFGKMLTAYGFVDPAMPDTVMRPTAGISASDSVTGLKIHHNIVENARRGIVLSGAPAAPSQASVAVSFNTIFDTWEYGIAQFEGGNAANVDIIGNDIDVDPYDVSPGRAGSNAWSFNYSASRCISLALNGPVQLALNTFSNCYSIQSSTNWVMLHNIVRGTVSGTTTGQPTSWSSANYGVGVYPPNIGDQFYISPITANTANNPPATFGVPSVAHVTSASAAPTSGYHVIGDMIWSTAPGTCACSGWLALTTGSNWTAGTDYNVVPLNGSTVSTSLGSTYTVPSNAAVVRFTQASTVATSTVTLPTALVDGQSVQFLNYAGSVTALTFSPTVNGWTNGSTLNSYTGLRVRWDATASAWYREQ